MRRPLIAIAAIALLAAACAEASPESAPAAADPEAPMTETTVVAEDQAPSTTTASDDEDHMTRTAAQSPDHDESTPAEDAEHDHDDDESTPAEDSAPEARQVDVVMTEFAFEPSSISVTAGETVTFLVRNEGVIEHEFRLTTHHEVGEHLAGGHGDHHSDSPMMLLLDPGAEGELEVLFQESGEYELYACMIEGHYEAGMAGDLIAA